MKADISVWELVQYYYCPKKLYFYKTLGIPVIARKKMEYGKKEHEMEHRRVKERKSIYGFENAKVYHKIYVEDEELGLFGQIDTVLELENSDVIPVEVKYSDFKKIYENWKKQLIAYSLLLEKRFLKPVRLGIFYFPKQKKRIEVPITEQDKRFLIRDIERIRELVRSEKIPRGRSRCGYCEVRKFCKD